MNEPKPISQDGEGYDILKDAILALLNDYPGLGGKTITFSNLKEDDGISMEPENGALIYVEKKDIIGNVYQECQFPFFLVRRSNAGSSFLKKEVNEFLDTIAAWICREPVIINQDLYQLTEYPKLTGGRKITGVTRFNSYALEPNSNGTQDWVVPITVKYTHEFTLW